MPTPNARLQVSLTGDPDQKRLKIVDPVSGIIIAEIYLDTYAQAELLSDRTVGSLEGSPAFISPDLDRVGKHVARVSVNLATVHHRADNRTNLLWTWAGMAQKRVRAYSYRIIPQNQGRTSVTFLAYFDKLEDADAWTDEANFILAELKGQAPGGSA
jgi:hypothetical protein